MAMKIPQAVQRQLDRAKELEDQQKEQRNAGPGPVDIPAVVAPVATPPDFQPHAGISDPSGAVTQDAAYWENQSRVEAGRLRAVAEQNARNEEALRAYEAREAELKQQLSQVTTQLNDSRNAERISEFDLTISEMAEDPEREDEAAMLKYLQQTVKQQGEVLSQLQGTQQHSVLSAGEQFWKSLREKVPTYLEINKDPAFVVWVNKVDEYLAQMTGQQLTRQDLLKQAVREVEPHTVDQCVNRVASIYSQWTKSSQPAPQTFDPDHSASGDLGDQQNPVEGIQWTAASVKKFYEDARRKRYPEDEFERLQADLSRAPSEGRYKQ